MNSTNSRVPLWNSQSKKISDDLLGFTGINYTESKENRWDKSLKNFGCNSWYKVKVFKPEVVNGPIVNPNFRDLNNMWQSIINTENANKLLEIEAIDERKIGKRRNRYKKERRQRDMSYIDSDSKILTANKIRLKPTKSQKIVFNKMFWVLQVCLQ